MKKIAFIFTVFLIVFSSKQLFSQDIPNVTAPSPTPFQLTQYGNVPINERSGLVSASIPIYTYVAGNLKLPISLNYLGNGVKVDELSTWTGINWNLIAGGVITRTVKDVPDELAGSRYLYTPEDIGLMNLTDDGPNINHLITIASSSTTDTQADIFSFSFLGISGGFYLDENLDPVLTGLEQNLKIDKFDPNTFIITDQNGVKYYFGGINIEQTRYLDQSGSNQSNTYEPNTAFYLYEIRHPFNEVIYLDYTQGEVPFIFPLSKNQSYIISTSYDSFCPSPISTGYKSNRVDMKVYNSRYLTKIRSNHSDIEIDFIANSITGGNSGNYNKKLESISIVDLTEQTNNQTINLEYLTDTERFFLKEVKFYNHSNIFNNKYTLDYNEPLSLPSRLSTSQDYIGFFNGKTNGESLIPRSTFVNLNNIPVLGGVADREPDFNFASKGVLTKINYPTGGFTSFEYEAKPELYLENVRGNLNVYCSQEGVINDKFTDNVTIGEGFLDTNGLPSSVGLFEDQNIDLTMNIEASGNLNHHYEVRRTLYDITVDHTNPLMIEEDLVHLETLSGTPYETYYYEDTKRYNLLKDHIYKVKLELLPDLNPNTGQPYYLPLAPVKVSAYFDYSTGYTQESGLGIRVKRVTDNSSDGPNLIKRYYYKRIDSDENIKKTVTYAKAGLFIKSFSKKVCCLAMIGHVTPIPVGSIYNYKEISTNPVKNYLSTESSGYKYPYITISYGGDNFENGGVEKIFYNVNAISVTPHHIAELPGDFSGSFNMYNAEKDNSDVFNDKVVKETYFKKKDNSLFAIKRIEKNYTRYNLENASSMLINREWTPCVGDDFASGYANYDGFSIGFYSVFSNVVNLVSNTTTDFIDHVPLIDLNNTTTYRKVIQTQTFNYDDNIGLPVEIITETSSSNAINKVKKYYPDQVNELDGLSSNQINDISLLNSQHRISEVIQQESFNINDGTESKLATSRNLYNNFSGKLLTEIIQSSKKDNPLEDRIIIQSYNARGLPVLVSKKDGNQTLYNYNSDNQLTLKIENYDVSAALPSEVLEDLEDYENPIPTNPCAMQEQHPNALVTRYFYESGVGLVTKIIDPRCNTIYYEYDEFNRLEHVKDKDGNILSKNEYNYKN